MGREKIMTVDREGRQRGGMVAADGPLAVHETALRVWMQCWGYAPLSVSETVRVMRWLSRWMGERGVDVASLTPTVFEEFLVALSS
jgi:hypothetical protein